MKRPMQMYNEVIDWAEKKKEFLVVQYVLANAYQGLAELYQKEKKYDAALNNYQICLENLKNAPHRMDVPKTYLMSLYLDFDKLEKADSVRLDIGLKKK